jgi:hypothetical protein
MPADEDEVALVREVTDAERRMCGVVAQLGENLVALALKNGCERREDRARLAQCISLIKHLRRVEAGLADRTWPRRRTPS